MFVAAQTTKYELVNLETWGLFHKTFFYVIYSKMAINYGIFEIMSKFTIKIWP